MVGEVGIEPTWLLPAHFKCAAYTNSATPPLRLPISPFSHYWCPHEESNLGLLITGQLLYHLTIRAKTGADSRTRTDDIKLGRLLLYQLSYVRLIGGRGEIRTHGGFLPDGFQDRCLKPLSHSPFILALDYEPSVYL